MHTLLEHITLLGVVDRSLVLTRQQTPSHTLLSHADNKGHLCRCWARHELAQCQQLQKKGWCQPFEVLYQNLYSEHDLRLSVLMSKTFFEKIVAVKFAHCCKLSTCCCWTCNPHARCRDVTLSYDAAATVTLTAGLVKRCHLLEETNVRRRTTESTPAHPTELLKDVEIVLLVPRIKLVLIMIR